MMKKRVVVTGLGLITPIGIGKERFWESAVAGQSGIGPVTTFDTSRHRVHIGGEVKDFKPFDYFDKEEAISHFGRQAQFAAAAAKMAFRDSGISPAEIDRERVAVVIGVLIGEPVLLEETLPHPANRDTGALNPGKLFSYPHTGISQVISTAFEFYGPSETLYCACSGGNMSIARACDLIGTDRVDMAVVGGVDIFNLSVFSTLDKLRLISATRCRPFDKDRDGTVFSEGAGILLVQSLESAQKSGRRIYAEIMGYGLSCDAYHPSSADPQGLGISSALAGALADAKLNPGDIDYICAHGTGTKMNDKVETLAIKKIFGAHSRELSISSLKSMTGHTMGAASAVEAALCCLVLEHQLIPPTINYCRPDPQCDLDYVPNQAREYPVSMCMNNSLAFGGINASLILGKCR
jgi:3-oxoacyl-[acyl-carrier-protein] synthase II